MEDAREILLEIKDVTKEFPGVKALSHVNLDVRKGEVLALVGENGAGKSTLINALLGHEYASMDVTPETAALTKFRSSERDYVHVKFYSKAEWDNLWASVQKGADKFLEEYKKLAIDACIALGLDYAGIDVGISDDDKPCFIEANSNAFFTEIEKVTGINITGLLVEYLLKKYKTKKY